MKLIVTYILLVLFGLSSNCQNLVPNPSFELNTSCPEFGSEIGYIPPWTAPNLNSTDYFDSCSISTFYSIPFQDILNYQEARTGNAFVGLAIYADGIEVSEYIQVQLETQLNINKCYLVEYYINRTTIGSYSCNNLSCSFSSSMVDTTNTGDVLTLPVHIQKFNNPIITDTANWVRVAGIHESNGTENFLTIGNFNLNNNTSVFNHFDGSFDWAYYFIDDVSVIPTDSIQGGMPAFAGNDTTIYFGDTIFIGQELYGLNCNWYDESSTQIATNISGIEVDPDSSTYYVVEQDLCGAISYDTIWVTVDTSNIGLTPIKIPKSEIKVFPNPTNNQIQITSPVSIKYVKLFGLDGSLILELIGNKESIDLTGIPMGTYILEVGTDSSILTERIVKN